MPRSLRRFSKTSRLAFLAKRRKVGLRFRYADDALATRMYRTTGAMIEGWTKNLALLFDNTLALVCCGARSIFLLLFGLPVLAIWLWNARFAAHSLAVAGRGVGAYAFSGRRTLVRFYARVAKSNFRFPELPALAVRPASFLRVCSIRSWFQHRILKRVSWKGRDYPG
jgi:hypothetical protein